MNRNGITFWNIKDDRQNGKPIIDLESKADMVWLRDRLANTAFKFKEMVGEFSTLAAHMSSSNDRYWGSGLIEIIVSRSEDDEILIEVHRRKDPNQNDPSLTLGFDKPKNWNDPIQLQPICASGKLIGEIILLGNLLLQEWPSCQRLRYRKILQPEIR